ncbi:hypothetical protein ACGFIF_15100 [Kribbella sp. NPDC049174]|uniref:hypothetical protein n=1 Tax=Kribbella sp. NPDC049174 TaxID=3364112 RepID=UPI003716FFCF
MVRKTGHRLQDPARTRRRRSLAGSERICLRGVEGVEGKLRRQQQDPECQPLRQRPGPL